MVRYSHFFLVSARAIFVLFCAIFVSPAIGAEYSDKDISPTITAIAFEKDTVSIRVDEKLPGLTDGEHLSFELPRDHLGPVAGILSMAESQRNELSKSSIAPSMECVKDGPIAINRLSVDKKTVDIPLPSCDWVVASAQFIDGRMWAAPYREGSHGDVAGGFVGTYYTGNNSWPSKRNQIGNRIVRRIVEDPFYDIVWLVTDDGVIAVSMDQRSVWQYQFYYELDKELAYPILQLELGDHEDNPLAVLARVIPLEDREKFSTKALQIPPVDVGQLDLYDFFMSVPPNKCRSLPYSFSKLRGILERHSADRVYGRSISSLLTRLPSLDGDTCR